MFAVARLSQFNSNPRPTHWSAVNYLIRYLIGTEDYGIIYSKEDTTKLFGYSDADHATDRDDRKSYYGNVTVYGNAHIAWKSPKQKRVTLSTMESEMVALSTTITELLFWDNLLKELPNHGLDNAPGAYGDNQASLAFVQNQVSIGRAKHIAIRFNFIKDEVSQHRVHLRYVQTDVNPADIFTKALPVHKFRQHRASLRVMAPPTQGRVGS